MTINKRQFFEEMIVGETIKKSLRNNI
jgi:hypothetical protein